MNTASILHAYVVHSPLLHSQYRCCCSSMLLQPNEEKILYHDLLIAQVVVYTWCSRGYTTVAAGSFGLILIPNNACMHPATTQWCIKTLRAYYFSQGCDFRIFAVEWDLWKINLQNFMTRIHVCSSTDSFAHETHFVTIAFPRRQLPNSNGLLSFLV